MLVDYASNSLARKMSSAATMMRAFGDRAKRLKMRLDVLELADSLADVPDVPPTRRHPLTGDLAGCFAVDVSGNWRLIFRPAGPVVTLADGSVDLSSVTAITIIDVIDYH